MIDQSACAARPVNSFGRRVWAPAPRQAEHPSSLREDLRLFALTFAGGFLFMAVYLA